MLAYFDCFSGISGDMTLGALIDLGVPETWLIQNLERISLKDFELSTERTSRKGISGVEVQVRSSEKVSHRHYADIVSMIRGSGLSGRVQELSLDMFDRIATAEAVVHGCDKQHVHFHEVGAVDAIVDIVGTCLCLEYLKISRVIGSRLPLGSGFVTCAHGTLPVPAPAVLEILKNVPVCGADTGHELVTPTGAAIITAIAESFAPMPDMRVEKIGYGAGQRDLEDRPNLLRVVLGTDAAPAAWSRDSVTVIETSIDNMNPEIFSFVMDRLFETGALDVSWTPVFMKKNRPATKVEVLCMPDKKEAVMQCLFNETTTLGIRYFETRRRILERKAETVDSVYGPVVVKRIRQADGTQRLAPEYEACKRIALEKNIPVRVVYDAVIEKCLQADKVRK